MPVVQSLIWSLSFQHFERLLGSFSLPFVAHGWEEKVHASLLHSFLTPSLQTWDIWFASILFCVVPGLFNLINTSFVDELLRVAVIYFQYSDCTWDRLFVVSVGYEECNCQSKGTSSHDLTTELYRSNSQGHSVIEVAQTFCLFFAHQLYSE